MSNGTVAGGQPEFPTLDELIQVYGKRAVIAALRAHYRVALWRNGDLSDHTDEYVVARLAHWRNQQVGETLIRAAQTRARVKWALLQ